MPPSSDEPSSDEQPPEFIESATFAGPKAGYNFKMGSSGMGYYKEDGNQTAVAPSPEEVQREEAEARAKANAAAAEEQVVLAFLMRSHQKLVRFFRNRVSWPD